MGCWDRYGAFHSHGGTPIARWMVDFMIFYGTSQSKMDDDDDDDDDDEDDDGMRVPLF